MLNRRQFLKYTAALSAGLLLASQQDIKAALAARSTHAARGITGRAARRTRSSRTGHGRGSMPGMGLPGGSLDPTSVAKYLTPLLIPPVMPSKSAPGEQGGAELDYYEISVEQFDQQVLPAPLPLTTVWGYGAYGVPGTHNFPSLTIEATYNKPVRVKWINNLMDPTTKHYLPHLLAVDQTVHWANPPGGEMHRDHNGHDPAPYSGPVPIVTHVHGAHTTDESDGYAEAWYLPPAANIPPNYATEGTWYHTFRTLAHARFGATWTPGSAVFQYPNDQRATTLWYHDHTLGMTRLNVYAGPAGFYVLRGGPDDSVTGALPGPAPRPNDPPEEKYYEIPIAIQDRSFNEDGSLFYPDNRAFFEGLNPGQLQILFKPNLGCDGEPSDVSPIWNPEFFGNTMVVNGRTWPNLQVEPRRYRFRFLNGCNSRFVILKISASAAAGQGGPAALPFWQIGAEGGFLPAPVRLDTVLMSPAERADVIVDFSGLAPGALLYLINEGPDEPFGGGVPGADFPFADAQTTGQVLRFEVVPLQSTDDSTPPEQLVLPARTPLGVASVTRQVALVEKESETVRVAEADGNIVLECENGEAFGPTEALLGSVVTDPHHGGIMGMGMKWMDTITENPALGATEVWEIYNFTMDAHPIHIHEVMFEVVDRQPFDMLTGALGVARPPELAETGVKDTVIAYPGEVTRVKARFDLPGLYVWHCHIVEHEDNEMMRPYAIGPVPQRLDHRTFLPFAAR